MSWSWFSSIFNREASYPKKITSLPTTMTGEEINELCKNDEMRWPMLDYSITIYASLRKESKKYDLLLEINMRGFKSEYSVIKEKVPLGETLSYLKKYDDKHEQEMKDNDLKVKRRRDNIKPVRAKLFRKGIIKY